MSYNRNNNYGDRDTLYTQAPPMAKSPSSNSPYYDDPRMTREWNGRDEYDDDRSYRSPPPPNNNNYDRQSEYYDDQPPYQQPYSRYDTISSPPPLTSSTISSSASQAYRPTPPNSSSPSPARGYNGNAPQRRAPATNPGQNRSAPPGFKIEGGALVPIVPRGSSHPTEIFYQPPKKVIRAMESYNARSANELTFVKGDFFYVVSDFERHYEVVNPLEKTRGIVPKSCFEGLEEMQARTLANARAAAGIEVGGGALHFYPGMDDAPPPSASPVPNMPPPRGAAAAAAAPRGPPEIIKPNADGFYVPKYQQQFNNAPPQSSSPTPPMSSRPGPPISPSLNSHRPPNSVSPISPSRGAAGDYFQPAPAPSYGGKSPGNFPPTNTRGNPNLILHTLIHEMELREDGKYYYALEIERGTGERSLLYRTFDDFWALQVALLNHFPSESGRRPGIPRIIPFLPTPNSSNPIKDRDMTPAAAKQRKQHLVTYLSELIRLPPAIMESPHTRRFFQAKQPLGDVFSLSDLDDALPDIAGRAPRKASNAAAVKAVTDVGGTLIDLIENYNGSGPAPQRYDNDYDPDVPYHEQGISPPLSSPNSPVDTSLRVKVDLGEEMLAFRIPDALVPFEELLDEVEDRMRAVGALSPGGAGLSGLAYKDECGMLVPLCGDEDLSLLFRTCPLKLVFYPR